MRKKNKKVKLWKRENIDLLNKMIEEVGNDIISSETYLQQDQFIQHGNITISQHCKSVARASLKISYLLGIKCEERALIRGALLHDYFLYDWHVAEKSHNWHGFKHAKTALNNANRDFELGILEQEIIKKHMWPLTIVPPLCREAWIVNLADTYCSLLETIHIHKNRNLCCL